MNSRRIYAKKQNKFKHEQKVKQARKKLNTRSRIAYWSSSRIILKLSGKCTPLCDTLNSCLFILANEKKIELFFKRLKKCQSLSTFCFEPVWLSVWIRNDRKANNNLTLNELELCINSVLTITNSSNSSVGSSSSSSKIHAILLILKERKEYISN